MSEQRLEDLNGEEFEKLVEAFVERDGPDSADLPMDMFFELWAQIEEKREGERPSNWKGKWLATSLVSLCQRKVPLQWWYKTTRFFWATGAS
jgi:hypothetical protein